MLVETSNSMVGAWIKKAETVQRQAWRTLVTAAPPKMAGRFGIDFDEVEGELFQAARDIPGFFSNKVFSFGIHKAISPVRIERAKNWLSQKCAPKSVLAIPPLSQPTQLQAWLAESGFKRHPLEVAIFMMTEGMETEVTPSSGTGERERDKNDRANVTFGKTGQGHRAADASLAASEGEVDRRKAIPSLS